jgi:hypothetical protein
MFVSRGDVFVHFKVHEIQNPYGYNLPLVSHQTVVTVVPFDSGYLISLG